MAVLYRSHFHRDELAAELAEQEIPFSIENLDVLDTSEARDLFACLGAVVSEADGASLLRVAALENSTSMGKSCGRRFASFESLTRGRNSFGPSPGGWWRARCLKLCR